MEARSAILAALALAMILSACSGSDTSKASEKGATDANKGQLFTVPKEQVSHIQIVTVAHVLAARLRLNGTVAYNSFSPRL